MTITQITFEQFSRETKGAKCVSGGEMFSGGSFSEFGHGDERNATHRFEMDAEGNSKWFKIED